MPVKKLDPQPDLPDGLGIGDKGERVFAVSPPGTPVAQGEAVAVSLDRTWSPNNAGAVITVRARLLDKVTFDQELTAQGAPITTQFSATVALQKIRRADVGLRKMSREVARVVLGQPASPDPADPTIDLLPLLDEARATLSILEAASLARDLDGSDGDVDDLG